MLYLLSGEKSTIREVSYAAVLALHTQPSKPHNFRELQSNKGISKDVTPCPQYAGVLTNTANSKNINRFIANLN